jgi:hypothetical protein
MKHEVERFFRDESGAYLVETIITTAIIVLVGGPILLSLLDLFVDRDDGLIFSIVDFVDSLLQL